MTNVYDVTSWTGASTNAANDIGAVINSIIADIKSNQTSQSAKPAAVIYIPPGDYSLKTRVIVDISYLQIKGSGHGFTSLSIRYNSNTSGWVEVNPGGSHVKVENTDGNAEAFLIQRSGSPRLSGIEFLNFCLDGVTFSPNENSYTNGKYGIRSTSDTDSLRISEMGFVYLEHAVSINGPDALAIQENMIAECGNCIELTGASQASLVSDNLIGAGPSGHSVYAEGASGLLITGNNIFPRGAESIRLQNSSDCSVVANRLHAFYSGMVYLEGSCNTNLIAGNHFLRQSETYQPFVGTDNGRDDLFGLVQLNGSNNTLSGNHFSHEVQSRAIKPSGATATIILVKSGAGNYLATNHTIASTPVKTVVLDASTTGTKVLDSGASTEFLSYAPSSAYGFRATP